MRRSILFLLAGCAPVVTQPNPEPPAHLEGAYAGRIVLGAAGDPLYGAQALTTRLSLLGARGSVTFDGDRVVIDVYDLDPARLPAIARLLVARARDRIYLDGELVAGEVAEVRAPTPECGCAAVAVFRLASTRMFPPHEIALVVEGNDPVALGAEPGLTSGFVSALALALPPAEDPDATAAILIGLSGTPPAGGAVLEVVPATAGPGPVQP